MDEQLKQKLIGYLDHLEQAAKTGGDFVAEHAPETVQQWITFSLLEAVGGAVLAMLAFFAIACLMWATLRHNYKGSWLDEELFKTLAAIVCPMVMVMTMCIAATNAHKALKIYIAPNVFIVEKVSELVRKG